MTVTHTSEASGKAAWACRHLDDPKALYQRPVCLLPISKDLRGDVDLFMADVQECDPSECQTYKTDHVLRLEVHGHEECDGQAAACLNGRLLVRHLVHALIDNGHGRGPHTGDFTWKGDCMVVVGEMSGMTNVGTHRTPVFDPCQTCDETGVLEGRLVGRVVKAEDKRLVGCCVTAVYRIKFDPSDSFQDTGVEGTLEGVIVCGCRNDACIDLADLAAGTHPSPLELPGIRFDVRNADGNPVAETEVVTWATVTGLNAGFTTKIQMAQPATGVAITLASFAAAATVTAYDSTAAVVDTAAMASGQSTERLVLTGADITTIEVESPQNETLILEICVRP